MYKKTRIVTDLTALYNLLLMKEYRKDFPIISKRIIYFDNAATSLTPIHVIEAMDRYYREFRANVHRGVHKLTCFLG